MQSRQFTASLKPMWSEEEITNFINLNKGKAKIYIINHTKDINEDGTPKEPHTHILIKYDTPRKIETIARLLKVENNFIERVDSFTYMLRYLTHKDQPNKAQYEDSEVITNDKTYLDQVQETLTNKEIMEYIESGRTLEIIDQVQPQKLRTLQSIFQTEKLNRLYQMVKENNEYILSFRDQVETMIETTTTMSDRLCELTTIYKENTNGIADALRDLLEPLKLLMSGLIDIKNKQQNIKMINKK